MKSISPVAKSGTEGPLLRLTEQLSAPAAGLSPIERQAAELLTKLPVPGPLSPQAQNRIGETLAQPPGTSVGWLISGGLGLAAVVAAATLLVPRMTGHPADNLPVQSSQPSSAAEPIAPAIPIVPAPAVAIAPVQPLQPSSASEPLRAGPRPARKHLGTTGSKPSSMEPADPSSLPVPTAAPPAEESALALESRLLGLALRELRQTRDAKQALIRLDEYASRFPSGLLKEEAQAARVDALMVLGRRQDALVLLDQATFTRLPRGGELTVLRGELRAASGRCRDALPDFAASVEASSTAEVAERGLYGQAMCRAHLGDLSGAEIDLRAYLARFPSGRFRASAQTTLRNLSATP
jgi:hypothetical protein